MLYIYIYVCICIHTYVYIYIDHIVAGSFCSALVALMSCQDHKHWLLHVASVVSMSIRSWIQRTLATVQVRSKHHDHDASLLESLEILSSGRNTVFHIPRTFAQRQEQQRRAVRAARRDFRILCNFARMGTKPYASNCCIQRRSSKRWRWCVPSCQAKERKVMAIELTLTRGCGMGEFNLSRLRSCNQWDDLRIGEPVSNWNLGSTTCLESEPVAEQQGFAKSARIVKRVPGATYRPSRCAEKKTESFPTDL